MLVVESQERAFIEKVNSRCFVDFRQPYWWTKMVHQYGICIQSSTKVRETFWQITQKLWATKTWDLNKLFMYKSFITFHFLGFFYWTVSNLFFCCVTVKTIYNIVQIVWQPTSFWNTWYHCKEIDEIGSSRWISFKTRRCLQSFLETKSRYGVRMLWSIGIELIFKP